MALQKHNSGSGNGTGSGISLSPVEAHLMRFLRAAESDYDQDLSQERMEQWLALLGMKEKFSLLEITEAFSAVQMERPGGWTGFPKRPDVIAKMLDTRDRKAEEHQRNGGWILASRQCESCGGTGWVEAGKSEAGNRRVTRCKCAEQKLAELRGQGS